MAKKENKRLLKVRGKSASQMHENVPPDWYYASMRRNVLQRYWHNRRFEKVQQLIEPVKGKILDIGSADGVFSKVILDKTHAKQIIGIDVLEDSVNWANNHWKRNKNMKFIVGDAHNLDFSTNTFDAVFALVVLEHVFEPEKVFKEIRRVLKKGGYAIFLVPADNFLFNIIWGFVTHFWWARIWKDCHVQSFSKENPLSKVVAKSGLKIEEDQKFILGMLNIVKARKI
ncbi:class I SAM-dependent methyltransferase [Candidatus Microgenomates bacterium]|nr:class I SAM-dependent methyltransferase [Candidatus Microgenomates bacterium]